MDGNMPARIAKGIAIAALVFVIIALFVGVFSRGRMMGNRWDRDYFNQNTVHTGIPEMPRWKDGRSAAGVPGPMMQGGGVGAVSEELSFSGTDTVSNEAPVSLESGQVDQKIIKVGSVSLKVENAEWSAGEIGKIAQEMGGALFSSDISGEAGLKSGTVTVRVPADRFDETLSRIKSVARVVVSESTSAQDVVMQYADLQARLKNKQAEEQAFSAILGQNTQKVSDILEVTRELARVRGEIEQIQAQIQYLDSQTDMSTITVFLSEDRQVGSGSVWRPWQTVKDAANVLVKNMQYLVNFLINLVIVILPVLLIVLFVFGGLVWWLGKKAQAWLEK